MYKSLMRNKIIIYTLNIRKTALATSKTPVKNTAKTADHFGKIGQIDIFDTRYGIAGIATKMIFVFLEKNQKNLLKAIPGYIKYGLVL